MNRKTARKILKPCAALLVFSLVHWMTVSLGSASVIDTMDETDTSFWGIFPENATVASTIQTSFVPGQDGNAFQMSYDLSGGNYVGISKVVSGQNLLAGGANALRFLYRATGARNTLEVKFLDADSTDTAKSDQFVYKLQFNPDGTWREAIVPFTDFITFPTGTDGFLPFATLFSLGATNENGTANAGGSLYVDAFQLYRKGAAESLIDSFETGDGELVAGTNARLYQTVSDFASGGTGSGVYVTTQAVTGAKALEFNYSVLGAGFAGFEETLGGMLAPLGTEKLEFFAKGAAGGEPLQIQIVAVTTVTLALSSYGTLTTSYQKFSIPLSDFAGLNLWAMSHVKFLFLDSAGTGRIYLDNVTIVGPAAEDKAIRTLEEFSLPESQTTFAERVHSDATLTMDFIKETSVPGSTDDNRVARFDYFFKTSAATPYAVADRQLALNMLPEPILRFRYKGAGANNNLEVKLKDSDGTEYQRRFLSASDTAGAWKNAAIPVEEFGLVTAGNDGLLNLKNLSVVTFALAKGKSGVATFALDHIESGSPVAFEKPTGGSVLTRVSTPDNPFSPNGDGVKDSARFAYTLSQTARVTLKVIDLRGRPLKIFDVGDKFAGDHVIEWDGVDQDGHMVSNGAYLFRLEAQGADGHDVFKQVIGVMK